LRRAPAPVVSFESERGAGFLEPGVDRADIDVVLGGDLFLCHPEVMTLDEGRPELGWELLDREGQQGAVFDTCRPVRDLVDRIGLFGRFGPVQLAFEAGVAMAENIDRAPLRKGRKECLRQLRLAGADRSEELEENLLCLFPALVFGLTKRLGKEQGRRRLARGLECQVHLGTVVCFKCLMANADQRLR
jgi:hypothetical protein